MPCSSRQHAVYNTIQLGCATQDCMLPWYSRDIHLHNLLMTCWCTTTWDKVTLWNVAQWPQHVTSKNIFCVFPNEHTPELRVCFVVISQALWTTVYRWLNLSWQDSHRRLAGSQRRLAGSQRGREGVDRAEGCGVRVCNRRGKGSQEVSCRN